MTPCGHWDSPISPRQRTSAPDVRCYLRRLSISGLSGVPDLACSTAGAGAGLSGVSPVPGPLLWALGCAAAPGSLSVPEPAPPPARVPSRRLEPLSAPRRCDRERPWAPRLPALPWFGVARPERRDCPRPAPLRSCFRPAFADSPPWALLAPWPACGAERACASPAEPAVEPWPPLKRCGAAPARLPSPPARVACGAGARG